MTCYKRPAAAIPWLLLAVLLNGAAWAGEPVQLTNDGAFKRDPVFWPGKNELIFCQAQPATTSGNGGLMRTMRMTLPDRKVEMFLASGEEAGNRSDREMAVSGDGRVIAYASVVNETSKMRVKDLANNKAIEFKRDPYVNRPTLSPKGDRLAFVKRGTQLVLLDLWKDDIKDINDEAKDQPFGSAGDMYPNYSPDGKRIVFTSRRDSDYEIYVINADGTGETRLTNSRGMDINARVSPDSRQIAFTSNRDGNYEVYVMNADGQNLRRITSHPERDDFPCWHPDGKHLVVVSERQGKFDLYQYDVPDR